MRTISVDEFAREFRRIYDMSKNIDGVESIEFKLKYHGYGLNESVPKLRLLLKKEMAESDYIALINQKENRA